MPHEGEEHPEEEIPPGQEPYNYTVDPSALADQQSAEAFPPVDWVPFAERGEWSSLSQWMDKETGTLLSQEAADVDKVKELRSIMAQVGSGVLSGDDIGAHYGQDQSRELLGGLAGNRGYIVSGYKFQALMQPGRVTQNTFSSVALQKSLNVFNGRSLYQINAAFHSMKPGEQLSLKTAMWHAGFYPAGTRPDFDGFSIVDGTAWQAFVQENQANPDKSMEGILRERSEQRYLDRRERTSTPGGTGGRGTAVLLSDPEVIKDSLRDFASQELGMDVDESQIEAHASKVLAQERANKQQYYDAVMEHSGTSDGAVNVEEVDMFLSSVSELNDGNIVDLKDWTMWARRAGLDPNSEPSKENMRIVGRFLAADYYDATQNWADVASLWFAGPGRSGQSLGRARQPTSAPLVPSGQQFRPGQPSIPTSDSAGVLSLGNFQHEVLSNMLNREEQRVGMSAPAHTYVENFNPTAAARRELIAANQAKHQTWQYANRAEDFFNLLAEGSRI